jgi:Protein of unknown function (DUF3102)
MSTLKTRLLTELASQIRAEHEACLAALNDSVRHAIMAGILLAKAKRKVDHGEWLPWLCAHCAISPRTAQVYMRCARGQSVIEEQIRSGAAHLSLREAAALLAAATKQPGQSKRRTVRLTRPQWDHLWKCLERCQMDDAERDEAFAIRAVAALRHCVGAYSQGIGSKSQDAIAARL